MKKLILFTLMLLPELAMAHARILPAGNIPPRRDANNQVPQGIKEDMAPCGGLPRLAANTVFTSGQTITISWEETIQHTGRYEFYFSPAGDANFTLIGMVADNQDANNNLPHRYTTNLTLPNIVCANCTLQMVQVMTDNAIPSNYYSCSDIQLVAAGTVTTTTMPSTATTMPPNTVTTLPPSQTPANCD